MERCDKVIISLSGFGHMSIFHGRKTPQIFVFDGTEFITDDSMMC